MNYWKWGTIFGLIIVSFFLGRCNGVNSVLKNTKSDTTVKSKEVSFLWLPVPTLVKSDSILYKKKEIHDTLEIESEPNIVYVPNETPDWTVDILNDWAKTRYYDTLITIGNDSILIRDVVTKNSISSKNVKAIFKDSVITKTTIIKPQRKTVGYITFGAGLNLSTQQNVSFGFALKNKNDKVYQIEYQKIFGTKEPFYNLRFFVPIRLLNNFKIEPK